MISQNKLLHDLRLLLQRVRTAFAEALSEENLDELFGATLTALLISLRFTLFMAIAAVDVARRWQSTETSGLEAFIESPMRSLFTLALTALWLYGLGRFFRIIGWPQWWPSHMYF